VSHEIAEEVLALQVDLKVEGGLLSAAAVVVGAEQVAQRGDGAASGEEAALELLGHVLDPLEVRHLFVGGGGEVRAGAVEDAPGGLALQLGELGELDGVPGAQVLAVPEGQRPSALERGRPLDRAGVECGGGLAVGNLATVFLN
jgi:hypothetical protein